MAYSEILKIGFKICWHLPQDICQGHCTFLYVCAEVLHVVFYDFRHKHPKLHTAAQLYSSLLSTQLYSSLFSAQLCSSLFSTQLYSSLFSTQLIIDYQYPEVIREEQYIYRRRVSKHNLMNGENSDSGIPKAN